MTADPNRPDGTDPTWADAIGVAIAVILIGSVLGKAWPFIPLLVVMGLLASCVLM